MANSLLDFVMSLVRDPEAAAHYAADPAQAIADAHLTDVTSVDVQNLIPVVAESLSMTNPSHGLDAFGAESAGNVWASGAATAAFDAFGDHVPDTPVVDTHTAVNAIVDDVDEPHDVLSGTDVVNTATSSQLDDLGFDHAGLTDPAVDDHWAPGVEDHWAPAVDDLHVVDHTPDFDVFD